MKNPDSHTSLPDIYEQYFLYLEQTGGISQITMKRKALRSLHIYLEKHNIRLSSVNIEHLDAFMAELRATEIGLRSVRSYIRGFLRYLYHEKMIIGKDLAPLLTNPPIYLHNKPPKFLRPHEIQQLFSSLKLRTPADIRNYAIVHLAYSLGLRPVEISRVSLNTYLVGLLSERHASRKWEKRVHGRHNLKDLVEQVPEDYQATEVDRRKPMSR